VNRLLTGDHQHRHATEGGVRGGSDEIGRTGSECREADSWKSGETTKCGRHEAGGLLVAGGDETDF